MRHKGSGLINMTTAGGISLGQPTVRLSQVNGRWLQENITKSLGFFLHFSTSVAIIQNQDFPSESSPTSATQRLSLHGRCGDQMVSLRKEKQLCGLIESKNNKTRYPSPKKKKGNQRCTEAVHQTGAVTLGLPHFLQQACEVFLDDDSCGMGFAESLLGTIYGFAIE